MRFDVIFSDRADETFEAIGLQIQERFGEREVFKFRKRVYQVIDMISISPLIFKAVGRNENVRNAFVHKNCSMIYEISQARIEILFFWDNRQDPIF